MAHATLTAGDLTAVIGDNEAYDGQRKGYNGIHRLVHRAEPESLFVPGIAGMNLEHIFDGDQDLRDVQGDRTVFFEPRNHPMKLKQISKTEVELHQEPTPTFHLESWTRFAVAAPHYVDFAFRCRPTQHVFRNDYIGLFWASYIHGPDDRSMYFRDQGQWQQLCTQKHNRDSTLMPRGNNLALPFTKGLGDSLYQNVSPLVFDEPFFSGRFREMVMIVMFEPKLVAAEGPHLRLTHSPSGGGFHAARQTANPAWDFQFILPEYEVLREYGFRARLVYRPVCDRAEIQREVKQWIASL